MRSSLLFWVGQKAVGVDRLHITTTEEDITLIHRITRECKMLRCYLLTHIYLF